MTTYEKELILKDLSARLPYGVKCYAYQSKIDGNDCECCGTFEGILYERFYLSDRIPINGGKTYDNYYLEVKPYLRPLSSMTETEKVDLINSLHDIALATRNYICSLTANEPSMEEKIAEIDYLNEHMFDYRGLIEKGLALEATKGMYNFEEEED